MFDVLKNWYRHGIHRLGRDDEFPNFRLHDKLEDCLYKIDGKTIEDLDIPRFIQTHDSTQTTCGEQLFEHWMKSVKSREHIQELQDDLATMSRNPDRPKLEAILKRIGKQTRGDIICDTWEGFSINALVVDKFYHIQACTLGLTIALSLLFSHYIGLFILAYFLGNLILYVLTNPRISRLAGSVHYFIRLCGGVRKCASLKGMEHWKQAPRTRTFDRLAWCGLLFKDGMGSGGAGDVSAVVLDYLRVFFCLEIIAFKVSARTVAENTRELRDVILYLAYVDCLLGTLRIMAKHNTVEAEIGETRTLEFHSMRHPLLEQPASQSHKLDRGLVVTGLNMSGKSTFMKSLGLNQILATSLGIAFADSFSTSVRRIVTSLRINDNLLGGKSRYFEEAWRLAHIRDLVAFDPCLVFIDEILSGTNSEDRIQGSIIILKALMSQKDSLVIAATHDNQIAEALSAMAAPVYFDGEISGRHSLSFDYQIHEGVASKRNGLLILQILGMEVPEELKT